MKRRTRRPRTSDRKLTATDACRTVADGTTVDPRPKLIEYGATRAEIKFLRETDSHPFKGRRVELQTLGGNLIPFVEKKLRATGVEKVIPGFEVLAAKWRENLFKVRLNRRLADFEDEERVAVLRAEVPEDLAEYVGTLLAEDPSLSWDEAVNLFSEQQDQDEASGFVG